MNLEEYKKHYFNENNIDVIAFIEKEKDMCVIKFTHVLKKDIMVKLKMGCMIKIPLSDIKENMREIEPLIGCGYPLIQYKK